MESIKKEITLLITGVSLGFLLSFGMIIFRVFSGSSIYSAMFFEAWQILDIALFIRPIHLIFLIFSLLFFVLVCTFMYFIPKFILEESTQKSTIIVMRLIGYVGLTYFVGEALQYNLMNTLFYQGVFNTVPYFLGISILTFSAIIILSRYNSDVSEFNLRKNIPSIIQATIFPIIAMVLIAPNLSAMAGILPDPPEIKQGEFGNLIEEYQTFEVKYNSIIPEETVEMMTEAEKEREWFVRIYVPGLAEKEVKNKTIPVAIFMHGFAEYEPDQFMDMIHSLTSKGNICVYIHYPSYFDIPDSKRPELVNEKGGENWPEMIYRYKLIIPELYRVENIIANNSEPEISSQIKAHIGENNISFSHLWMGGMSLGAGMLTTLTTHAISQGWGNNTFIINGEVPSVFSTFPEYYGDLTNLPNHTIVNILNADEDHVVPRCSGKWIFERFFTRDGAGLLNDSNSQYILINSDRRGFPRLVATHYLSANAVRDALSDFSVFKRFDAQATYIHAIANSNTGIANEALPYFTDPDTIKNLGKWSDGESVISPIVTNDPLGTRGTTELNCQN